MGCPCSGLGSCIEDEEFASVQPRLVLTVTQNQNVCPARPWNFADPAPRGPSQSTMLPSGFTNEIRKTLPSPGLDQDTSIAVGSSESRVALTETRGRATCA